MSDATAPHPLEARLADLPAAPGCYLFKGKGGEVLYVGKAKDLRTRVRSYFRGKDERPLVPFLAKEARDLETIATRTEAEAILLEDTLVKRFRPRFNLQLKDDKAFYLLRLDREAEFPRLEWVRRRRADRALYFGPYASSGALRRTIRFLHTIFPLRDCSDAVLRNRSRPCLKHAIGRCAAPCVGLVSREAYRELVDRAVELLQGKTARVVPLLEAAMREAASRLEFERAAKLRDHLEALRTTTEAQGVRLGKALDRDAIGLHRIGVRVAIQWLPFREGCLEGGRSTVVSSELPDAEILGSFLTQFYRGDAFVPREIYLSLEPNDREAIAGWLESKRGGPLTLAVPKGGEAKRSVRMAVENARFALESREAVAATTEQALERLRERFHLTETPSVIDCFDVSTLQGRATVASRVRFVDGLPAKDGYRRFKVTRLSGQDDFAALTEVVTRALRRGVEEQSLPDLVVIDGGKGQLSAALAAREETGAFEVAIVGLAKDRVRASDAGSVHSGERVFVPGAAEPLTLHPRSAECHLLERIRDEAHRFAIQYHRKIRGRLTSEIDGIEGIGAKRRRELLTAFGSVEALRGVTAEEIRVKLPRFPRKLAERVAAHFGAREPFGGPPPSP